MDKTVQHFGSHVSGFDSKFETTYPDVLETTSTWALLQVIRAQGQDTFFRPQKVFFDFFQKPFCYRQGLVYRKLFYDGLVMPYVYLFGTGSNFWMFEFFHNEKCQFPNFFHQNMIIISPPSPRRFEHVFAEDLT